jgi:ATP-dependent Lon protease
VSILEETTTRPLGPDATSLPILPLRDAVVFPNSMTPLAIGQERSIRLVDEAVARDRTIALVTSHVGEEQEAQSAEDLYDVGSSAVVHKMIRVPDGTLRVLVQGLERVKLEQVEQTEPYLAGLFTPLPDVVEREKEVEALARSVEAHGLEPKQVTFTEKGLRVLVREYTREAGVRNLEREIAAVCRKAAREIAEGKRKIARVDERRVRAWLGRRRFPAEVRKRTSDPGVATGLAVTPVGGDVLFVEATAMPGKGRLTVTGQIGDVMRESAQAALSWVRGHGRDFGLDSDWFENRDVHIHVPAGAVPKDGPSAGIAMATALASHATGKPVSEEVAMTGEITLTGQVLPIGGVKEKVLAAQRAGISTVILPRENEADLDDLPADARDSMRFVFADGVGEVLRAAFPDGVVLEFPRAAGG